MEVRLSISKVFRKFLLVNDFLKIQSPCNLSPLVEKFRAKFIQRSFNSKQDKMIEPGVFVLLKDPHF